MKSKLLLIMLFTFCLASLVSAQGLTDDFNRTDLGSNWSAQSQYAIQTGNLVNTSDTTGWNFLATFVAAANPLEISLQWAKGSNDIAGVNAGGIAAMLDAPSATANGYVVVRRYATIKLYPVAGGILGGDITMNSSPQVAAPAPGDALKVIPSTDADGHHFDLYIKKDGTTDFVFDGRVSDPNKLHGNTSKVYGGVVLYGNVANDVDKFSIRAPLVQLTFPNGGEKFMGGTSQTITWNNYDFSGNVDVLISYDSGASWTFIVENIANSGSYTWTVPDETHENCRIKIVANGSDIPFDVSDADFEIEQTAPTITVTSPNGGENWIIGTQRTITWQKSGQIDFVDIYYTPDDGVTRYLIQGSVPADLGYYNWTVPTNLYSENMKIIIEKLVLDQIFSDESDNVFSVSALVHLYVQNASGEPGTGPEKNIVRVGMSNKTNVRAVMFSVTDDKNILDVPIIDNSVDPPLLKINTTGRAKNFTMRARKSGSTVRFAIVALSGVIQAGDGPILEIFYDLSGVGPEMINKASELYLSEVLISDANSQEIIPRLTSGHFYYVKAGDLVEPFDTVDDADIDKMAEVVLGTVDPEPYILSGDMDNDGDIDIFDLLEVYELAYPNP